MNLFLAATFYGISLYRPFLVSVVVLGGSAFPVWVVGSFEPVFLIAFFCSECSGAGSATGVSVSSFQVVESCEVGFAADDAVFQEVASVFAAGFG